jgi:thiamine pyrophosphate-dependent acetolactate synthase large subunit-like protein
MVSDRQHTHISELCWRDRKAVRPQCSAPCLLRPDIIDRHPNPETIARAAEILKAGRRAAIFAGQGVYHARDELIGMAELLGAPIVKAPLGRRVVPDDHPPTTGGPTDLHARTGDG